MKASCKTTCESRMREIRTSGLMRGKEVSGHCLCALIPWLPSLLYPNLRRRFAAESWDAKGLARPVTNGLEDAA